MSPEENNAQISTRKRRCRYTSDQLQYLDDEFDRCNFPSKSRRKSIADAIGMTECNVRFWFQNRRQRGPHGGGGGVAPSPMTTHPHAITEPPPLPIASGLVPVPPLFTLDRLVLESYLQMLAIPWTLACPPPREDTTYRLLDDFMRSLPEVGDTPSTEDVMID